jgi:hypothetical protein
MSQESVLQCANDETPKILGINGLTLFKFCKFKMNLNYGL